jgi:hypothetical protein
MFFCFCILWHFTKCDVSVHCTFCDRSHFVTFYLIWHLHFRTVTFRPAAFWPCYITWSWRFVTLTLYAATFCKQHHSYSYTHPFAPATHSDSNGTFSCESEHRHHLDWTGEIFWTWIIEHYPDDGRRVPMCGREGDVGSERNRMTREWGQTDFLAIFIGFFFYRFVWLFIGIEILLEGLPFFSSEQLLIEESPQGCPAEIQTLDLWRRHTQPNSKASSWELYNIFESTCGG